MSPDYFKTLRIPLVEGREFSDDDWSPVATKVIVNESFARQHFPEHDAVGHRINGRQWKDLEVIGVVADARERPDGEIQQSFYLPNNTGGFLANMVLLRAIGSRAGDVLAAARGIVAHVDPQLATHDAASLEEVLEHSAASPKLYGLVSLWCALSDWRWRRSACTACSPIRSDRALTNSASASRSAPKRAAVRWQVLRQGLVALGRRAALGLAGSYASARALTSLLFGVTPGDLTTFAVAATLLLARP